MAHEKEKHSFKIAYPNPGQSLPIIGDGTATDPISFSVFGYAHSDFFDTSTWQEIKAFVDLRDGTALREGEKLFLRTDAGFQEQAFDWGFQFNNIPLPIRKGVRTTVLLLGIEASPITVTPTLTQVTNHFPIMFRKMEVPGGSFGAATIAYPANGATVPKNFSTYGTVSPTNCVMGAHLSPGTATPPIPNPVEGVRVTPPPSPYDWCFQFNCPSAGSAVLTISATDTATGKTTMTSTNLTLS